MRGQGSTLKMGMPVFPSPTLAKLWHLAWCGGNKTYPDTSCTAVHCSSRLHLLLRQLPPSYKHHDLPPCWLDPADPCTGLSCTRVFPHVSVGRIEASWVQNASWRPPWPAAHTLVRTCRPPRSLRLHPCISWSHGLCSFRPLSGGSSHSRRTRTSWTPAAELPPLPQQHEEIRSQPLAASGLRTRVWGTDLRRPGLWRTSRLWRTARPETDWGRSAAHGWSAWRGSCSSMEQRHWWGRTCWLQHLQETRRHRRAAWGSWSFDRISVRSLNLRSAVDWKKVGAFRHHIWERSTRSRRYLTGYPWPLPSQEGGGLPVRTPHEWRNYRGEAPLPILLTSIQECSGRPGSSGWTRRRTPPSWSHWRSRLETQSEHQALKAGRDPAPHSSSPHPEKTSQRTARRLPSPALCRRLGSCPSTRWVWWWRRSGQSEPLNRPFPASREAAGDDTGEAHRSRSERGSEARTSACDPSDRSGHAGRQSQGTACTGTGAGCKDDQS